MATVTRLISPAEWVNRQINGLKSNGETNYKQGIAHPKKDPILAGVAAEAKWQDALKTAFAKGTRAKNLGETTMAQWETNSATIGAPRLVDGVVRRQYKVNNFVTSFSPLLQGLLSSVDAMPTGTANERDAKSKAMVEGLRALRGTW